MDSLMEAETLVETELGKRTQKPEMKKDLKGCRDFYTPVSNSDSFG
jgi:hypothetical protein